MPERLGRSIYLTEYEKDGALPPSGAPAFLSLHVAEEYGDSFPSRMLDLCRRLHSLGCPVTADVGGDTEREFGMPLPDIVREYHLSSLRLDEGFTMEQTLSLAKEVPVVLNASSLREAEIRSILQSGAKVRAMHNFYPRRETGLDREYLKKTTDHLHACGIEVEAFVPGDTVLRGPLLEGLPTLEEHRHLPPSAGCVDLLENFGIDRVYVGDPGISEKEEERIRAYLEEGVLGIPCALDKGYEDLYGTVFTCRSDSPAWLVRAQESRQWSKEHHPQVAPGRTGKRARGCVTMDNAKYLRYQGEVQLIRRDLEADERVNVIGRLQAGYERLADLVERGGKFRLEKE